MANSIGRIDLDLGVNTKGFKKELSGIGKLGGNLTSVFGKLGAVIGVAFSVKAITSFAKSCIDLGSDLAEVQNVVDVTFGSMSGAVNKWAKDAMTSYGLSEKVAKEYMGQFGAMSKAFGNTEQMAYDQAAALTGLAGDVASFYNMTTDEAFGKLKSVYTGETEALKSLGVVMTQSALDSYALANGFGKTTKNMSEQEKVALRLAFVQDKLAGASGDFARTSDGWANQVRVLSLRFDALKASIGQGLIAALTPVIRMLNTLMGYLQAAADAFSNFMQAIFGKSGGSSALSSAGADLAVGVGSASSSSSDLADNAASAAGSAAKMKKSLAGFDNLNVLSNPNSGGGGGGGGGVSSGIGSSVAVPDLTETTSTTDALKQKLDALKNKLLEIANITGLSGLWDDFLTSVDNVRAGLENIWEALRGAVKTNIPGLKTLKKSFTNTFLTITNTLAKIAGDRWRAISDGFKSFTSTYKTEIEAAFSNVISIFTNCGILISNVIGEIYGSVLAWWEADGKRIYEEIISVIQDIGKWVLDLWNTWVAPVIEYLISAIGELWDQNLKPLWNNLLDFITDLWDTIKDIWDSVLKPLVTWIIEKFGPPVVEAAKSIIDIFKDFFATVSEVVDGILTALRGVLTFLTGIFTGDWNAIWDGLTTVVSGAWDALTSGAAGAWDGIKSVFSTVATFFGDIFSEAWTAVKNVFSVGGEIFDGITEGIVEAFKTVVNAIISGINTVVAIPFNAINGVLNKIRSISILGVKPFSGLWGKDPLAVPQIPKLASGGYVAANTPQLAIIGDNKHEGEIVAPESKIAEAVAAGFASVMSRMQQPAGNNERPMYLTLKLGEDTFWEGFINYHNSIVKRTGDSPLLV